MRQIFSLVLAGLLLSPLPANCWWETGHRTVARIAAAHLTPTARLRVARILGVDNTEAAVGDGLAAASTWADEVKNDTKTAEWHYIDLTLQDDKSDILRRCQDSNCVSGRIRLFAVQLGSPKGKVDARWSDLDALRFLVHFVGDVHQPLHAISDQDLGGNCEVIDPPIGDVKNVHALWDGGIVNALDSSDQQLAADIDSYLGKLDDATRSDWAAGVVDDWVWESHQLAKQNIYGKLHIPVEPVAFPSGCKAAPPEITSFKPAVDTLYIDTMKPIVRDQLGKAGLRLAKVLNETL
jgi:hypothetical protein